MTSFHLQFTLLNLFYLLFNYVLKGDLHKASVLLLLRLLLHCLVPHHVLCRLLLLLLLIIIIIIVLSIMYI